MTLTLHLGGHRGLGCTDHDFYQNLRDIRHLPVENSLESIEAAFAAGADYIETDAVMSADGVIFTLHNVVPKDHFFGEKVPAAMLNTMTFDDIQSFMTGRCSNGKIETLMATLDKIAALDPGTMPFAINIEIKGVQGSNQPFETNDYLDRLAKAVTLSRLPLDRVVFSSFCLQNVIAMSHRLPDAQYGVLFAENMTPRDIYPDKKNDVRYQYLPFDGIYMDQAMDLFAKEGHGAERLGYLHPEFRTLNPDTIAKTAAAGMGINCWSLFEKLTPDRKRHYHDLAELCRANKVPFSVITDYIQEMKAT